MANRVPEQSGDSRLLICYRRDDTGPVVSRLADYLRGEFGSDAVFVDTTSIPMGRDFETHIRSSLAECCVMLVIIGRNWLIRDEETGRTRLHDKTDYVGRELEWAKEYEIDVIPVLIDEAKMPGRGELPEELSYLATLNAHQLRSEDAFFYFAAHKMAVYLEEERGFSKKRGPHFLLCCVCTGGAVCTAFGSIVSVALLLTAFKWDTPVFLPPSQYLLDMIAFQVLGPVLMGIGVLIVFYAKQQLCVLRALERRPAYLLFGRATQKTHPSTFRAFAFGVSAIGLNVFGLIPAIVYGIDGMKSIRKSPSAYRGVLGCRAGIALGVLGFIVSTLAQAYVAKGYQACVLAENARSLLEDSRYEQSEAIANELSQSYPGVPETWVLLGESIARQGDWKRAFNPLSNAIAILEERVETKEMYGVAVLQQQKLRQLLVRSYSVRADCYARVGEGAKSDEDLERASELAEI